MVNGIRLTASLSLLIGERFFSDNLMIIMLVIVLILSFRMIDQQRKRIEDNIACQVLRNIRRDFIDAAAKVRGQ